jgi:branched-chain amino acid transport system ATP-binding protein
VSESAVLEIEDLNVWYGHRHAVKSVSLTVPRARIVALLGANGAGKTSLIKAVLGLVPRSEGRMAFLGAPILGRPTEEIVRQGIGYVPEGRRIFATLTVEENLLAGAYVRQATRDEIQTELEGIYERFPVLRLRHRSAGGSLSGGEQQMLALGRALMSDPKLLLLDEPSLGLAPKIVHELFGQISGLRDQGRTVLLAEQNARLATEIADSAYVLETGKAVLAGAAKDLWDNEMVRRSYLGT